MRLLPLVFVLLPIVELLVLIEVGDAIGALPTVALVVLAVVLGVKVVKRQGWTTLRRANERLRSGQLPAQEMLEGFLLALGGLLLIVPGFVSDAAGLLLLLPPVRRRLVRALIGTGRVTVRGGPSPGFGQGPFGQGPFSQGPFGQGPFNKGPSGADPFQRPPDGRDVYEGEFTREQPPRRRLEDGEPRE